MEPSLSRDDRMRLMRFVCSFAWADLEVQDEERALIARMADEWELSEADKAQVALWLVEPPPADAVDPTEVPSHHRRLFLSHALDLMAADGVMDEDELAQYALFSKLIPPGR